MSVTQSGGQEPRSAATPSPPAEESRRAPSNGAPNDWYLRVSTLFDELRARGRSSEEIFVEMFDELKQLARMKIARRSASDSMHATRLLSDLWLRLFANRSGDVTWESAGHFVAYVTRAMASLLIDHWRQVRSRGGHRSESLDQAGLEITVEIESGWAVLSAERVEQAVYIDQLLERIERDQGQGEKAAIVERQANIVRLRLFVGCTEEETAGLLGCSSETVTKEFRKARAKLARYAQEPMIPPG